MPVNILNKRGILLTGTIIPNSVYTNYNDSAKRLQDHLTAIEFYCTQFKNDDVFFIENSEFDLESNINYQEFKKKHPFKTIRLPKSDKYYEGKGYQEFEMLDTAIELLKKEYTSFIKITGRYIVSNVFNITDFECKGLVIDLNRKQKYSHTYLLYFTTEFYLNHLKGEYKHVNDNAGIFIEHVVYKKLSEANLYSYCSLFRKTPLLSGTSGSYGIEMKRNYYRVKIRNMERFFYNLLNIKAFFY